MATQMEDDLNEEDILFSYKGYEQQFRERKPQKLTNLGRDA